MSSIKRSFKILELISSNPLTFSEILANVELPKSTVWSILLKLEEAGAIEKDNQGKYHLGSLILKLGLSASKDLNRIKEIAEPFMKVLSGATGELCLLTIFDKDSLEIVYVSKIEGNSPIHVKATVGSSNPSYCTSSGKLFLSFLTVDELESYFRRVSLKRFTSNTITEKSELIKELERIRNHGYAIDRGEHIEYSMGISAPIYNHEGICVAALVLSGLNQRVGEKLDILIPQITKHALEISKQLGYETVSG